MNLNSYTYFVSNLSLELLGGDTSNGDDWTTTDIVTLVIAGFSFILAAVSFFFMFRLNKLTSSHSCDLLLLEIEKQIIAKPRLKEVYGEEKLDRKKDFHIELESFALMHLNTFQMVHDFIKKRKLVSRESRIAWENYMQDFMEKSQIARDLMKDTSITKTFEKSFVRKMRKFSLGVSQTE